MGDSDLDLGFAPSYIIESPTLVPGQTTYLAATYLGPEGIALGMPGPVVTTVPDTLPLASSGCDPLTHPTCSGSCQIAGHGLDRAPIALRHGDDLILAYLDVIVEVEGHFEGFPCDGGRFCSCEFITDDDRSALDLTILRVDLPSVTTAEVMRTPLPIATGRLFAAQRDDRVVLAIASDSALFTATLDLNNVP